MKKFYYGNIVAVAAFLIWLTVWGTYSTFSIFLKPIVEDFGWERADLSLAYSVSSLVQGILAILMGRLTDKLGPRLIVSVFGSFLALSYFLLSKATELWHFQLIYAFLGSIGLSTATIPIMATIARWFDKNRGTMTGIVQSGMGIGGLIFAPFTGWMILEYNWQTAYFILALICFPVVFLSGLLLKRDPGEITDYGDNKIDINQKSKNKEDMQRLGLSLKGAIKTSQFWMIAGMFFSFGFCRTTFLAHTGAHVQDIGFSLADGANVVAILIFSSIIGRVGVGFLADKFGCRNIYLLSYCTMIVALLWGKTTYQLWGLFLFAIMFGISWGGQAVVRFTFTAEMFGLASLGVITGVLGITESLGAAFGSFFAGFNFDLTGSYEIIFTIGALLSLGGILLAYFIKPITGPMENRGKGIEAKSL